MTIRAAWLWAAILAGILAISAICAVITWCHGNGDFPTTFVEIDSFHGLINGTSRSEVERRLILDDYVIVRSGNPLEAHSVPLRTTIGFKYDRVRLTFNEQDTVKRIEAKTIQFGP